MYKAAIKTGATVEFGTTVISIQPSVVQSTNGYLDDDDSDDDSDDEDHPLAPPPSVTLSTGEVVTPDIVIGADGYQSIVRKTVFRAEEGEDTGLSLLMCVTFYFILLFGLCLPVCGILISLPFLLLIHSNSLDMPREKIIQVPELQELIDGSEWSFWMGSGRSINGQAVVRILSSFIMHDSYIPVSGAMKGIVYRYSGLITVSTLEVKSMDGTNVFELRTASFPRALMGFTPRE